MSHADATATRRAWRDYALVTGNYWAFTLTDGALRMLVVLHFHQLGYGPLDIALLFLFYEAFGVVTNLVGGWLGARIGLNRTMHLGLGLQVLALAALLVPAAWLTVPWVMAAQAVSGIAKDLNKMSAKASLKQLVPADAQGRLYRWVAALTGSKNALKGVGFFLGGALLAWLGFRGAVGAMALGLLAVWAWSLLSLRTAFGRASAKPKFRELFAKSRAINLLSGARLLLFGARDVWFVVALPVFLVVELGWATTAVGGFLALWIIGYGVVQSLAPWITGAGRARRAGGAAGGGAAGEGASAPDGRAALGWALALAAVPAAMALGLGRGVDPEALLVGGLALFGLVFALNSALHSYLIVSYASEDGVSLDVGFYYMANALGRLLGTLLSGWLYQAHGLAACLWASALMVALAAAVSVALPRHAAGRGA